MVRLRLALAGLLGGALLAAACCGTAQARPHPKIKSDRLNELIERRQMIFFVAKGEANACGPSCAEWIAAEGAIDEGAARRLSALHAEPARRGLPVFFNSPGGDAATAVQLGLILRQYRMTAGVGRTKLRGCSAAPLADPACRKLMQSRSEHRAQFSSDDAWCFSACPYAMAGASFRKVALNARMSVHSLRPEDRARNKSVVIEQGNAILRRYLVEMGVDGGLIDMASKVSNDKLKRLDREDIARFGIESRSGFETHWTLHSDDVGRHFVLKALTTGGEAQGANFQTGVLRIGCENSFGYRVVYRRELLPDDAPQKTQMTVSAGERMFSLGPGFQSPDIGMWTASGLWTSVISMDAVRSMAGEPAVLLTETPDPQSGKSPGVTKLSTAGMAEAVTRLRQYCAPGSTASVAGAGSGTK
jgi:hypothetical protein